MDNFLLFGQKLFCAFIPAWILAAAFLDFARGQDKDQPEKNVALLQRLRASDAAYVNKLQGKATLQAFNDQPSSTKRELKVKFTSSDTKFAIEELGLRPHFDDRAPKDKKGRLQEKTLDDKGNRYIISQNKTLLLFTDEKQAQIKTDIEYTISPKDEILQQADLAHGVKFHPPDSLALVLPRLRILWSLGRGFSKNINRITSIDSLPDGRLKVIGEGISDVRFPGKWHCEIDPQADYLVRKAVFIDDESKEEQLIIDNEKIVNNAGCFYPKLSKFSFPFGEWLITYQMTFDNVSFTVDEELLKKAVDTFGGDLPPSTNFHDNRVDPPIYKYIR